MSGISYASHGALTSATYGNGLVNAATYNSRLQVSEIKLGTGAAPNSKIDLTYNYGATNNNGNLQSTGYSLDVGGFTQALYTQSFSYDSLNRLSTATETSSGGSTSWSQTNGYDRYGNRWIDLGGGNQSLYFTAGTNRITGWSYDASGNLLNDGVHAYTYNAESKISKVDNVSAYVYDGSGQRVKKLVGENTRFIYGISGQLVAEFDGSSGSLKKEYVYGGGTMATIAPNGKGSPGTQYTATDTLGTPRVVTNSSGVVVARHDYMPFGEELFAGTGGRTTAMGFSVSDGVRQKFTGYERDTETGLDFAQARYNSSTQGRFTSVDPLQASARLGNPQSWNRYTYVLNNPLRLTDPSGMRAEIPQGDAVIVDSDAGQQTQQPTTQQPQPPQSQGPQIDVTVGKVKIYNGEKVLLPNGETAKQPNGSEISGYGPAAVVTITATDNGGPIDPKSGVTLEETVKLDPDSPPKPEEAGKLSRKIEEPEPIPLRPGGIAYDVQGALFTDSQSYQAASKIGFAVTQLQTLTLKDSDGNILATRVNRITKTQNSIKIEEVKPKTPK